MKHTLLFLAIFIALITVAISQTASPEDKNSISFKVNNKAPETIVEVTFQVNMANETVSGDGVYMYGSVDDPWEPVLQEMTPIGGDIYSITVELESGSDYYYLFFNGNTGGSQETVPWQCQNDSWPGFRYIYTGSSNVSLDPVCFGYCIDCAGFHDITFEVDMKYQDVSTDGVYIVGEFTSTSGIQMDNVSGTTIWSETISLMEGATYQYLFVNGDPQNGGTFESWNLPYPPCTCGDFRKRCLLVPDNDDILNVCFEYCSSCPNLIISEVASPVDNPLSGFFIELYNAGSETIEFDSLPIWLLQYSPNPQSQERLTGSLAAGAKYVIGSIDFDGLYGFTPNVGTWDNNGIGNDAFFLYMGNENNWFTQIDAFGSMDGSGNVTTVNYTDTKAVRLRSATEPSPTFLPSQWHFPVEAYINDMTPAAHDEDVSWTGSLGTNWNAKGNWTGLNGYIPDASFNVNIPNTANDPSVSATASTNNLSLQTGASLTLEPNKWLSVLGDLDISAGNMTIQSSAAGEGSLITYGSVSGVADIEKNMSDGAWHLVSSPVSGATANVFYGEYLQAFDENTGAWSDVVNANDPLNPKQGYALWGVAPLRFSTYIFSGIPGTGNQSFPFTYTTHTDQNLDGWNLIGNPYPSAINWDTVAETLPAGVDNAIYYLDASDGSYQSYVDGAGTGSPYIPAMQGFWVHATASGSFTVNNTGRTHQGSDIYYKNEKIQYNYIELIAARGSDYDQTFIRFKDAASAAFDGKYDAYKLMAPNQNFPQLFTYAGDDILSVNQLPAVEVMDMGFYCGSSGNYTILLAEMSGVSTCMLEDLNTGQTQNLKTGSYSFSYTTGEDAKRFKLHFGPTSIKQNLAGEDILIYAKGKKVIVASKKVIQNSLLQIADLSGRIVLEKSIDNQQSFNVHTGLQSGIYIVTLTGQGSVKTEKVMIE